MNRVPQVSILRSAVMPNEWAVPEACHSPPADILVERLHGQQTRLEVALHLKGVAPGLYYPSTTHETDHAVYYYPLEIVP